MSELAETLKTLRDFGLLGRAQMVRSGDVELHLGPPMTEGEIVKPVTAEEERRAYHEALYAAAQGDIPGA